VTDDFVLRRAVVSCSGLIYWAGVLIQARRIRRHIGRSPNLKPRGLKERLLWAGWFIVVLTWILQPLLVAVPGTGSAKQRWILDFLTPEVLLTKEVGLWTALLSPSTLIAGLILIVAGYAGTLWCYRAMGDSWRIGVNKTEKNALITLGPYRAVRHPIYLFQIVMLAGAFFLLPTILSLAILLFHFLCVLIKAADEEAYLLSIHGQLYKDYLSQTGGLFPKVSRL